MAFYCYFCYFVSTSVRSTRFFSLNRSCLLVCLIFCHFCFTFYLFVWLGCARVVVCVCGPRSGPPPLPLSSRHPLTYRPFIPSYPPFVVVVAVVFLLLFIKTTALSTSTPRRSQPSHSRGNKEKHAWCTSNIYLLRDEKDYQTFK